MNTMSEDDARQKWCPHAVASHTNPRAGFEPLTIEQPKLHYCIGSACMAWRWESYASRDNPTRLPGAGQSFDITRGFCGLAGRP